jgi:DNA-binding transcriptional MerR regulator
VEANETYQIGELAARSGLTPDTLRYYERLGLLAAPHRTSGGFRVYSAETVDRLRFIKQAQNVGLTLHEIAALVSYQEQGGIRRCRQVRDLLHAKLGDLEAKLRELQEFRNTLSGYLQECERTLVSAAQSAAASDAQCPVIEDLRTKK